MCWEGVGLTFEHEEVLAGEGACRQKVVWWHFIGIILTFEGCRSKLALLDNAQFAVTSTPR